MMGTLLLLLRRTVFTALVLFGWVVIALVVLWNWPSGFHAAVSALGRALAGLRLEHIQVQGRDTPFVAGGRENDPLEIERTPVLLLHGWGTSKEAMMGQMRWLSPSRRVVAPDLPGFGENPFPIGAQPLDADGYIQWIEAFRIAAGLGRVDVVGESMGGAIAAAYSAAYPQAVRRLVLESPAGLMPPKVNTFMQEVARGGNPLDISSHEDFERVMKLCFAKPPPVPAPFRRFLVARAIERRPMLAAMVESLRPFLLDGNAQRMASIRAPTLVIFGAQDKITDPSLLQLYVRGIRGAEGLLVPDAGHVIFHDAPAATQQALLGFLDR
jgi:pimeloyl-ACP methyl ester carboxylesterase